jgi:hypothetical protein
VPAAVDFGSGNTVPIKKTMGDFDLKFWIDYF